MKRAHEIRQVTESNLERNIADAPVGVGEKLGSSAKARPHEILMRGEPRYSRKQPQKVKRTHARQCGDLLESQWLTGMGVDEQGGLDGAPAVS